MGAPATPSEIGGNAGVEAATGGDVIRQTALRAAQAHFPGRDVAMESYYDQSADRAVYRLSDRRTGEILFESPPEELLRFFASVREPPGAPLVTLEA